MDTFLSFNDLNYVKCSKGISSEIIYLYTTL